MQRKKESASISPKVQTNIEDLFEVAILALFPVHHVMEDGDHNVPHFLLRYQRHSQEGANHPWDEVDLILTFRTHTTQHNTITDKFFNV